MKDKTYIEEVKPLEDKITHLTSKVNHLKWILDLVDCETGNTFSTTRLTRWNHNFVTVRNEKGYLETYFSMNGQNLHNYKKETK